MIDKTFTHDGKRYRIRAATEEEWYTKKANKIRDIDEGRVILHSSMTVRSWTKTCLKTYKVNITDDGFRDMELRLDNWMLSKIGDLTLKQVKPLHCQEIMNSLKGKSWSLVDKVYQEMRFVFKKAVENELLLKSPADNIIKPDAEKGTRRPITDRERAHFLKVCDKEPRFILFLIMLYCGCRPAETWDIIGADFSKIGGETVLHIRGTKTENSDRYVPVPDYLLKRLPKVGPFEHVCQTTRGKKYYDSAYKRLVKKLYREMNISMGCKVHRNALVPPFPLAEDFVPYDLRHTYCTDLARAGVDIRVAQVLMGHSTIEITARIYTHIEEDFIVDAAKIIREYQNGSSQKNKSKKAV